MSQSKPRRTIPCPHCGDTQGGNVIDTHHDRISIYRLRVCKACGLDYETEEIASGRTNLGYLRGRHNILKSD